MKTCSGWEQFFACVAIVAASTASAYEGPTPASCETLILPDASQLSGSCGGACRTQPA